jgi:hypothetical protein
MNRTPNAERVPGSVAASFTVALGGQTILVGNATASNRRIAFLSSFFLQMRTFNTSRIKGVYT